MNVRNCHRLKAVLSDASERAGLKAHPWALFGSAVMQLHGLRDEISDVDVAVHHRVFEVLANSIAFELRCPDPAHPPFLVFRDAGGDCAIFYAWRSDEPEVNLGWVRLYSEVVKDWPCAPLIEIAKHKLASIRYVQDRFGHVPERWGKHVDDYGRIMGRLAA